MTTRRKIIAGVIALAALFGASAAMAGTGGNGECQRTRHLVPRLTYPDEGRPGARRGHAPGVHPAPATAPGLPPSVREVPAMTGYSNGQSFGLGESAGNATGAGAVRWPPPGWKFGLRLSDDRGSV